MATRFNRSEGRKEQADWTNKPQSASSLLQQIDHVRDVVRHRIVDNNIPVVISHLVARRRRRQIGVHIRRYSGDVRNIGIREEAAHDEVRSRGQIDAGQAAQIVAVQPRTIIRPPTVRRTMRRRTSPLWWSARSRRVRTRWIWPVSAARIWPWRIRPIPTRIRPRRIWLVPSARIRSRWRIWFRRIGLRWVRPISPTRVSRIGTARLPTTSRIRTAWLLAAPARRTAARSRTRLRTLRNRSIADTEQTKYKEAKKSPSKLHQSSQGEIRHAKPKPCSKRRQSQNSLQRKDKIEPCHQRRTI